MISEDRHNPDALTPTTDTVAAAYSRPRATEETAAGPANPRTGTAALSIIRGPGIQNPVTIELTKDTTLVGRHPGCDIVLNDPTVSRHHVELRRAGGEVTVTDLGSLNGTYINQVPTDRRALADGDTLWIGRYRLVFRSGTALGETG